MLDTLHWYIAHTHPKQEDRTASNLSVLGIEVFNPKVEEGWRKPYTDESKSVISPLFPTYIFARFKLNDFYHKVRYTRGLSRLVSVIDTPCPVDEQIINLIRQRAG